MFRVSQHPSSGVLKTVPAASGTGHTTCTATRLQRGLMKIKHFCELDSVCTINCTIKLIASSLFFTESQQKKSRISYQVKCNRISR